MFSRAFTKTALRATPLLCAGWFSQSSDKKSSSRSSGSASFRAAKERNSPSYDYSRLTPEVNPSFANVYADRMDTERVIPLSEVKKHCTADSAWFTYKGEVFDMTPFRDGHPGLKSRFLMAAGNDLEPYWEVYQDHLRGHVVPFLKKFKIGNLSPGDAAKAKDFFFPNAYDNDPVRHPDLIANTYHPFNGECVLERLTEKYYTPNELHYVRAHLPIPEVDPEDYELEIVAGNGIGETKTYTLKDLKTKFKWYDVVSTLQCAGNRREDFHGYPRIDGTDNLIYIGPHWVVGAMGCSKWTGVRLRDVLADCGLDSDGIALNKYNINQLPGRHLHLTGLDCDETGLEYGVSIPIDKAIDPLGDCLIAFHMNGQPLPRDHGYPCRVLVPGFAGARNCKWVQTISLEKNPSMKPWHENAYRGFSPDITFQDDLYQWEDSPKVTLHGPKGRLSDHAPIALEQPIQSMICNPPPNAIVGGKGRTTVEVKGFAWSGGGRGVHRVDCSIDGGASFYGAELFKPKDLDQKEIRMRQWGWYHFKCQVPLSKDQVFQLQRGNSIQIECCSKAVNGDYNVQPETPGPVYNARGIQINHYYRVPVTIDGKKSKKTLIRDVEGDKAARFRNRPTGGKFLMPWKNEDGSQDHERINASELNYEQNVWWNYTDRPQYAERHFDC